MVQVIRHLVGKAAFALLIVVCLDQAASAQTESPPTPFQDGRTSFAVTFQDETARYFVLVASFLPHEEAEFAVVESGDDEVFTLETAHGDLLASAPQRWCWRAPAAPGLYPVRISRDADGESILLNIFVVVPLSGLVEGRLGAYVIGGYPEKLLNDLAIYEAPAGLIEVTPENMATPVSPHFTLDQFLCPQESGFPKYLALKTRLVRKLEQALQQINAEGIRCDRVTVVSGYRTPWYNKVTGNEQYSRHVWGGAADIIIDENPRDGEMDDLNADGRIDHKDAGVLYRILDDQYGKPVWKPLIGNLGEARRTESRGPFVHVDVRGFRARWGD